MLLASAMLLATVASSVNAAPTKPTPENFGGSENSLQHRNDASGKGNFGQCHRTGLLRTLSEGPFGAGEGEDSQTFNPTSQNVGEANCRQAGTYFAGTASHCPRNPEGTYAHTQVNYLTWPNIEIVQTALC